MGINLFMIGSFIAGIVLGLVGYYLWSGDSVSIGVLCIASGAGFILLGIIILMTDMMMTMSVENIQNVKGKRGGPL